MAHPQLPPSPASPPPRRRQRMVFTTPETGPARVSRPVSTTPGRSISASEVARNITHFETWAMHQGCEQVAFSDLPEGLIVDVQRVFDTSAQIPMSWIDEESAFSQHMKAICPQILEFLQGALSSCPQLFSNDVKYNESEAQELLEELATVRLAWKRLRTMRRSGGRWSEADYAANVYNVFRSPAIRRSSYRCQCPISLPQPHLRPSGAANRILHPKTAIPDSATFINAATIRHLSRSLKSPYKTLNMHPTVSKHSQARLESSFRYQSTPCAQPPDTACFEFASSFWEDKKPAHELLEHAYRQNRMATAAATRMLHSLQIEACVFGLVWAEGTVRAHVDWCTGERGYPAVFSAPYPGTEEDSGPIFHEWDLERPSDILQVYLLLRNIDVWTSISFRERISIGVEDFAKAVTQNGQDYMPWKRLNELNHRVLEGVTEVKENVPPASGSHGQKVRR